MSIVQDKEVVCVKVHVEQKAIEWFLLWSRYMIQVHSWSTYQSLRMGKLWAADVFPSTIQPDTVSYTTKAKKVDPAMLQKSWQP
eukprot:6366472-Amphidinium_carterae.1